MYPDDSDVYRKREKKANKLSDNSEIRDEENKEERKEEEGERKKAGNGK